MFIKVVQIVFAPMTMPGLYPQAASMDTVVCE